ncbi:MAG: DnaJ domain-containing protein [Chitinophagales bacterium]
MKDYYKILEVSENATEMEIKKNFRRLAARHHPDRNQGSAESEAKFKEITEAYNVLSDSTQKSNYDFTRKYRAPEPETPYQHYRQTTYERRYEPPPYQRRYYSPPTTTTESNWFRTLPFILFVFIQMLRFSGCMEHKTYYGGDSTSFFNALKNEKPLNELSDEQINSILNAMKDSTDLMENSTKDTVVSTAWHEAGSKSER